MAIRHGNKTYLQILLDPNRAELLKEVAEWKDMRPTALVRETVYKMLEQQVPPDVYTEACLKDQAEWQASVRRRVEGRLKSRRKSKDSGGSADI
jgi:hypothetical protein